MSRHKSGSIVTKNNKIYARLRFVDEVGKKRDIWRIVSSRVEAKKKLRELIKDSETKTTIESVCNKMKNRFYSANGVHN